MKKWSERQNNEYRRTTLARWPCFRGVLAGPWHLNARSAAGWQIVQLSMHPQSVHVSRFNRRDDAFGRNVVEPPASINGLPPANPITDTSCKGHGESSRGGTGRFVGENHQECGK
jgi:hypothetical protein